MGYRRSRTADALLALARSGTSARFWRDLARTATEYDFHRSGLDRVALEELVDHDVLTTLTIGPNIYGDTPLVDLFALAVLVARRRPSVLFEFGTFTGAGTLTLAANSASDSLVHTLDLPPKSRSTAPGLDWESEIDDAVIGAVWRDSPYATRISQHLCDSRAFDTTPLAHSVDFLFIDGGHSLEIVTNDTEKAFEMARPDATIVWHDYSRACPDVQRCLMNLPNRRSVRSIRSTSVAFLDLLVER